MWVKAAAVGLILSIAAQDPAADEKKKKEEEAKAKIAEFRKELKTCKTEGDICLALQNLGSVQHPKILEELRVWVHRPQSDICGGAAEQIGKYAKDRMAADILMTAAKSRKDGDGIIKCLRYAGDVGYKPIAPLFNPYFRNKSTDVAKEAVDSLGKLGCAVSVEPLIKLLREIEGTLDNTGTGGVGGLPGGLGNMPGANLPGGAGGAGSPEEEMRKRQTDLMPAVQRALKNITGERWGTSKEWDTWWRKNRGTFKEKA